MKVIDLLNGIANYGEYKQEFHFKYYDRNAEEYDISLLSYEVLINKLAAGQIDLNDEVEIIEDKKIEENNGIEGLWMASSGLHSGEMSNSYEEENLKDIVKHNFNVVHNKINEIIVVLNEMSEDK